MSDDPHLDGLRRALEASPDNEPLLSLYVRALSAAGEHDAVRALLSSRPLAALADEGARLACAASLRSAGEPARALDAVPGHSAEQLMERARCLDALERLEEARGAYDEAMRRNPTLEDPTLRARLEARPVGPVAAGQPRLRVVANDDTRATEVDRLLAPTEEVVRFADVGGLEEVKRQIHKRIILPYRKPSLFLRFRKRVGGGILMYGPPGCGKTLLARATAGECNAKFFNVAISDVLDMYIGESERKLEGVFERARQSAPAVLFFDELEALAGKRQFSREGASSKLVSQFLAQMDGFTRNNDGVLILGATNVPWAVDPAFRRPGRFDRVIFVPPPDQPAREAILRLELDGRPHEDRIDVASLAKRTRGFSGADLAHLVEEAADRAIAESLEASSEVPIRQAHLVEALDDVRSTTTEWLTTARNHARYANESGQYDEVLDFLEKHAKK